MALSTEPGLVDQTRICDTPSVLYEAKTVANPPTDSLSTPQQAQSEEGM